MQFSYLAADPSGTKQKGLIEANSEHEVLSFLRENSLIPIKITLAQKSWVFSAPFFKKIKSSDIVLFTRQLSSMLLTGLTLIESLEILKKQTTSSKMQNLINDLSTSISEGASFSEALGRHPDAFSEVYIALIRAAETGGLLDKVLTRLADNLEKLEDLKKRVRSAMFYPSIVITGVIIVIIIMNVFVIPQLGKLYENLNLKLPLTTRIVLGMSRFFSRFYLLLIPTGALFLFAYKRFQKTESGMRIIDKLKLKIPVLGAIITLSILDELTRTLSLLVSSGLSIIEAITITANTSSNVLYKDAMKNSGTLVEKGIPFSQALDYQNIFPPIVVQMVKVGESTGKIDENLLRVSEYFERDLDIKIKTLTTAIEPILIMALGVAVAFLILSVITPIYSLVSQIQ